jgi:phosphodiesterase/alkaline phosphatase D-like protein
MRTAALTLILLLTMSPRSDAESQTVTHGPILGRLGSHEIGVWVRTSQPGPFRVRYGTATDRLDQLSAPATTRLERDNTGWVLLSGLKAETKYLYEVVLGENGERRTGLGGSFRTLPDPAEGKEPKLNPRGLFNFRFEFACGNNQNPGQGGGPELPAFKTMLAQLKDKVQFAILNGDWLYEDKREYTVEEWALQAGPSRAEPHTLPHVVRRAPNIVGVWENYKAYLSRGKNLAAWHREVPSFFTFDDHEILNDVWGAGSAGLRDRRAVFRDIGVQAWYDFLGWSNPVPFTQGIHFGEARLKGGSDVLTDAEADFTKLDLKQVANLHVHWGTRTAGVNDNKLDGVGGDPNAGVYDIVEVLGKDRLRIRPAARAGSNSFYSIGRRNYFRMRVSNCDFFFLDTRSHREMHDVRQPDKPGLSMLGKPQKEWLMEEMKKSDADFFFVVSSVNFMVPHVGGGAVRGQNKDDAWTVFLDEREQLIRFWDGLGRPVFVLTGDLHNSFAIKITDRVWEFASGPHNSQNHIARDEGGRPASGVFDSRGRKCDIRWSSYFLDDIPRDELRHPLYCVVQVNNVFNSPRKLGDKRWVAFPRPQVVFQFYDGRTGELRYAEAVTATR